MEDLGLLVNLTKTVLLVSRTKGGPPAHVLEGWTAMVECADLDWPCPASYPCRGHVSRNCPEPEVVGREGSEAQID